MDNVMKQQQQAYESASNKQEVKEQGQEALDSAKDLAVQTKCASARCNVVFVSSNSMRTLESVLYKDRNFLLTVVLCYWS